MIAIDDKYDSYRTNYDNLVKVLPFYNHPKDSVLLKLMKYLEDIKDVKDVRTVDKKRWLDI